MPQAALLAPWEATGLFFFFLCSLHVQLAQSLGRVPRNGLQALSGPAHLRGSHSHVLPLGQGAACICGVVWCGWHETVTITE